MAGKVILITGCSSGLGLDLAIRLTQAGHRVVATARDRTSLDPLPTALKLSLDVTNQGSVDRAVQEALERFGRIDVLVNNAGMAIRGAAEEVDEARARSMFDVNVWGLLRVSRAVLPSMRAQSAGRIIQVGSVVGRMTWPINGAYSASKYAVEALSDAMRVELKSFGIPVVLIEPGTIDTHFMKTSETASSATCREATSPYAPLYQTFYRLAADPARKGARPERVTRVIQHAIEVKRPKPRYLCAVPPLYRFLLMAGDRLRDRVLERVFT